MTRTSPSSGLLDTFLSGNPSKACFDSQKQTYFGNFNSPKDSAFPGSAPLRRSQCLCESGSMASGLCFKLVYLGVGPSPKWRPSKSQGCQSLGIHSGVTGFRVGVELVELVVFCTDFQRFFFEKSRWKTLPGGARGGTLDFPKRVDPDHCTVKLILEILLLFFSLESLMKWCHVQCRSLKTHVIVIVAYF